MQQSLLKNAQLSRAGPGLLFLSSAGFFAGILITETEEEEGVCSGSGTTKMIGWATLAGS